MVLASIPVGAVKMIPPMVAASNTLLTSGQSAPEPHSLTIRALGDELNVRRFERTRCQVVPARRKGQ